MVSKLRLRTGADGGGMIALGLGRVDLGVVDAVVLDRFLLLSRDDGLVLAHVLDALRGGQGLGVGRAGKQQGRKRRRPDRRDES